MIIRTAKKNDIDSMCKIVSEVFWVADWKLVKNEINEMFNKKIINKPIFLVVVLNDRICWMVWYIQSWFSYNWYEVFWLAVSKEKQRMWIWKKNNYKCM